MVSHLLRDLRLPPFRRYSVMPVARNVWLLIRVSIPVAASRRHIRNVFRIIDGFWPYATAGVVFDVVARNSHDPRLERTSFTNPSELLPRRREDVWNQIFYLVISVRNTRMNVTLDIGGVTSYEFRRCLSILRQHRRSAELRILNGCGTELLSLVGNSLSERMHYFRPLILQSRKMESSPKEKRGNVEWSSSERNSF